MDEVFEALSYVRRHTSNPQVLLICDTLSRLLLRNGNTVADMSQVAVVRPIPASVCASCGRKCSACAAQAAKANPQKPPQSKAKRTKAKKRKRPVAHQGPKGNNAPAASPTADPVTANPETSA